MSDIIEITLRTGPTTDNKIIAMLPSDTQLEILEEEEGWSRVRTAGGKEGWTLSRYLTDQQPKTLAIADLKEKLTTLSQACQEPGETITRLQAENDTLGKSLASTRDEQAKLQRQYADLRHNAANVLAIRDELHSATERLKSTTAELAQVTDENRSLRTSAKLRWFLAGAGVVLFSWLFGYLMGNRQKRQKRQSLTL